MFRRCFDLRTPEAVEDTGVREAQEGTAVD